MLSHAVDRHKWQDKGATFDIGLELRVCAIDLLLAQLEAASATKHNIDNSRIA